jgi:hypothetical protein
MTHKTAYCFSPVTGEYSGEEVAQPSPLEPGEYLLPANATFTKPPSGDADEIAVWSGERWIVRQDWRGREYWLPDGTHHIISDIGEGKPQEALEAPPPPSLETVKQQALTTIASHHAQALNELTGNATLEERDTWPVKAEAALAWSRGSASEAQINLLTGEAKAMGEEIDDLVAKISARSDAYHALVGMAAGLKRKSEKQVQDCQSLIQVETALASATEDVQAAIAAWPKESG